MKKFNFLNIATDDNEINVYLNGEIVSNDMQDLLDWFGVDGTSPNRFIEALNAANGKPLTLHINSIGGEDGYNKYGEYKQKYRKPVVHKSLHPDKHLHRFRDTPLSVPDFL